MKGEIPEFKRCCCCLPLRYGLIAWGYFKIIVDLCLIPSITYTLVFISILMEYNDKETTMFEPELILLMIAITLFLTDLILTLLFIVGAHKKNLKLIRAFYFHSMGVWVATFLLASFTIIISIHNFFKYKYRIMHLENILMTLCFYFVVLVAQTYFLLLLRSEITKLRNFGEFRFVNNAAEAECTMRCEEVVVATETVKPDDLRDTETNLEASQMKTT
ncbi:hypothetical protein PYW08_011583 [Mythimna loreyi]|uniref:Uncharacterized protein n=1 Tax=Mythimna loreyi TaxID=667449 RepID=A0ACC2QKU4_9NEOP|nr:hypothetical protein PYW08_011583 [Mythimna loreyi]